MSAPEARRVHGRRKGRPLRPGRQALVETLLPRIAVPAEGPIDPAALFDRSMADLWLEVGFGGGEHLAWQAERHPDIGFIGCEPFVNGVAKLLAAVETERLDNIRVQADDARSVIDRLPAGSVGRVFVLFPDPWPKTRHAKRRFVQTETLDALARIMRPGAELRLATDDPVMRLWMLRLAPVHPQFEWTARRASDWRERPGDWPETRYERKAARQGRRSTYFTLIRRSKRSGHPEY